MASELGVVEVFWLDDSGVVSTCSWISCVFVVQLALQSAVVLGLSSLMLTFGQSAAEAVVQDS